MTHSDRHLCAFAWLLRRLLQTGAENPPPDCAGFPARLYAMRCAGRPTAPTAAWNLGEKMNHPLQMYLADIYTLSANLAGLPAMSLPCGFSAGAQQNRPVGM